MVNAKERRDIIADIVKSHGVWNVNKSLLAERFGVSRQTIYKDLSKILDEFDAVDVNAVSFQLSRYFQVAIDKSLRLMDSDEDVVQVKGIRCFNETANNFTKFLESFGYKQVVSQHLNVANKELSVSDEEGLALNIKHFAEKNNLSIKEYIDTLFPDEKLPLQWLKAWVKGNLVDE